MRSSQVAQEPPWALEGALIGPFISQPPFSRSSPAKGTLHCELFSPLCSTETVRPRVHGILLILPALRLSGLIVLLCEMGGLDSIPTVFPISAIWRLWETEVGGSRTKVNLFFFLLSVSGKMSYRCFFRVDIFKVFSSQRPYIHCRLKTKTLGPA